MDGSCRTPHGVRGFRTPHGVRGLKYRCHEYPASVSKSHPAWGAWIEMWDKGARGRVIGVAPRMGCVD